MKSKTTKRKVVKVKAWWVRRGAESFLISKVYMNYKNAWMVAKGQDLDRTMVGKSKAVPVVISYSLTSK